MYFYNPELQQAPAIDPDDDHLDALQGTRLPINLHSRVDLCLIHGIRCHEGFAKSDQVTRLCAESSDKRFARARNARLIMSDIIPDMPTDADKPYCVWYPDLATEDTYRQIANQFPDMRYHVGRACAVAGYHKLYLELELLPDASIAEEARDNLENEGSQAILRDIMKSPACFAVMDDYTRTVNIDSPRSPAFMSADTAVRSSLATRFGLDRWKDWHKQYFNIAEDYNIAEESSGPTDSAGQLLASAHTALLYTPLASHLPATVNKDALILMAAYEGNLERYVRLRRPFFIDRELQCVIRGIYHNTTFAKWWSLQTLRYSPDIKKATLARFIMVNDLSHITPQDPKKDEVPALIWWPLIPTEDTLRELVRRRPDMKLQVAMACIEASYKELWDELKPDPSPLLLHQARQDNGQAYDITFAPEPNRNYYSEYQERRGHEEGIDVWGHALDDGWGGAIEAQIEEAGRRFKEPTSNFLWQCIGHLRTLYQDHTWGDTIYPGALQANAAQWELCMCSSEDLIRRAEAEDGLYLYKPEYEVVEKTRSAEDGKNAPACGWH